MISIGFPEVRPRRQSLDRKDHRNSDSLSKVLQGTSRGLKPIGYLSNVLRRASKPWVVSLYLHPLGFWNGRWGFEKGNRVNAEGLASNLVLGILCCGNISDMTERDPK